MWCGDIHPWLVCKIQKACWHLSWCFPSGFSQVKVLGGLGKVVGVGGLMPQFRSIHGFPEIQGTLKTKPSSPFLLYILLKGGDLFCNIVCLQIFPWIVVARNPVSLCWPGYSHPHALSRKSGFRRTCGLQNIRLEVKTHSGKKGQSCQQNIHFESSELCFGWALCWGESLSCLCGVGGADFRSIF